MELLLEMLCQGDAQDMDWAGFDLVILNAWSHLLLMESSEQLSFLSHLDLMTSRTSKETENKTV